MSSPHQPESDLIELASTRRKSKGTKSKSKKERRGSKEIESTEQKPKVFPSAVSNGVVYMWGGLKKEEKKKEEKEEENEEKEEEKEEEKDDKKKLCVFRKMFENVNVSKISCGGEHVVFVTSCNRAFVWGSNSAGQLGLGMFVFLSFFLSLFPSSLSFSSFLFILLIKSFIFKIQNK